MPTITPQRLAKLLQQQTDMFADEARMCPFDDDILARAWWRSDDLDLEDAIELRRELLEKERLIELGSSTSSTTAVAVDELVNERGYTPKRIRELDDDGLLAVKWDNPATRRKGYVLSAELDALPMRLAELAAEEARQRQLRQDFVAGRRRAEVNDELSGALPDCLL